MTTSDETPGFDWLNSSVVRLIDRYVQLDRKAIPQDAEQSRVVREVAEYYAANYEGSFLFMCEMRAAIEKWHKLSAGQTAATINCLMAEYKRRQAPQKPAFKMPTAELPDDLEVPNGIDFKLLGAIGRVDRQAREEVKAQDFVKNYAGSQTSIAPQSAEPITPVVHNGTYTIVLNEAGDYRTLRLSDVPESMGKPEGMQIAAYLYGSDNCGDFQGFAFVTGDNFHLWKSAKPTTAWPKENNLGQALTVLLQANAETRAEYGYAYAVESGRCYRCNRRLTVPTSIHRGLGPDCAKR